MIDKMDHSSYAGFHDNTPSFMHTVRETEAMTKCQSDAIDQVYHSSSMHEMRVKADVLGIDLCNQYILFYLARTTAYHDAFWPHTKKRFIAFKTLLRKDKTVRKALLDGQLLARLKDLRTSMLLDMSDPINITPGYKKELKNIAQLVQIAEKAVEDGKTR